MRLKFSHTEVGRVGRMCVCDGDDPHWFTNAQGQHFGLHAGAARVPPFVNLSHNQLGPELAEYALPPSIFAASVIDIRHNASELLNMPAVGVARFPLPKAISPTR